MQMPSCEDDRNSLPERASLSFLEQLRAAVDLLERLESDRNLLESLPAEDRNRLHQAVAQLYNPDPIARRRRLKAAERERSAAQIQRVGAVLQETGIRTLRRKAVFTTPNVFAPEDFKTRDVDPDEPQGER